MTTKIWNANCEQLNISVALKKKNFKTKKIISDKHNCEKMRLEKAQYLMITSQIMIIIFGTILAFYGLLWLYISANESKGIPRKEMPYFIILCSEEQIGNILTRLLGFCVAIPAQVVFSAPWRSYAAASTFALIDLCTIVYNRGSLTWTGNKIETTSIKRFLFL